MFTGIVENTGKIEKIKKIREKIYFIIKVNSFLNDVKIGDSICCDGICLTVIEKKKNDFTVELMPETLKLTKFNQSKEGEIINLEKSLKANGKFDGHFVMGHIDGVGKIKEVKKNGDYIDLIIKIPSKLNKFLAYKGSVGVNGVSLTISGVGKNWFRVSLITYTLKKTNLKELQESDIVNLEVDIIARYLNKLIKK